ncbi:MXAN_6640 family putative metalloprotease [Nocardioides euryhalodurans]|uniref:Uncharacterized protein n=1 Tax=Nocardioides euryhalodurans TaxID=2518370 RepID=A0A4P7GJ61_9ACTN|nr:MXAN_6640 family putative metalloprotease [Nocardioides euryhalodurans]QBR91779.1 hypothetical protein EXE57_05460 [Nocardioides euryhalodurans]
MRRTIAAAAACLGLATTALTVGTTAAAPGGVPGPAGASLPEQAPDEALETAAAVLDGEVPPLAAQTVTAPAAPDASLALRDLLVALPRLTGEDRDRAEALLARPTDRAADPYGDGYTTRANRSCSTNVCVHWVPTTRDAPPSRRWVRTTMKVMQGVWRTEVGALGYRRPVPDGRKGGNRKLDVYLKELGSQGLYGYCAPEGTRLGSARAASGYCVLDDDFARSQFGRKPVRTLRVTAAHEFFHAVQFAYDHLEHRWLLESTATWVEERYADAVNDNRQYLPGGQLWRPGVPLDREASGYGNWVFFEYLGQRFGNAYVRRVWEAAARPGTGSVAAVRRALPRGVTFTGTYTAFAMANVTPGRSYPEGESWTQPGVRRRELGAGADVDLAPRLDRLSATRSRFAPGEALTGRRWQLRVVVDGPARASAPGAGVVRVAPDGSVVRTRISLDAQGRGRVRVPFNVRRARDVYVVLANAGSDRRRFRAKVDVVRRG